MSRRDAEPYESDYQITAFVLKELLNEERHDPGSILRLAMLSAADQLARATNPPDLLTCSQALAELASAAAKHQSDKTQNLIAALKEFRDSPDIELPPPIPPDDEGIIGRVKE